MKTATGMQRIRHATAVLCVALTVCMAAGRGLAADLSPEPSRPAERLPAALTPGELADLAGRARAGLADVRCGSDPDGGINVRLMVVGLLVVVFLIAIGGVNEDKDAGDEPQ